MALLNPRYAASIENPRLWPPDDLNETPGSIVHARLLKIIDGFRGSLAANNSKARAIRRSLIDAIDELTSATIKNSLAASVALQTVFVDAFPEQPDSSRSRLYKYSPVSSFASTRMVHLALQLSTKLRPLRVPVQFKVASEHQVLIEQFLLEIRNFKVAHHHDPLFVSKNRIREAELNKKEAELSKLLTPDEWASIDKDHLTSSLILQGELLLLPRINAGTSAANLKQAASWLDRLGSAMQITFRINPSAPRGTHEEQSVAANQYTNSGVVFCVLALWLHYLSTNSSRRCEICYRNVKADAVHY